MSNAHLETERLARRTEAVAPGRWRLVIVSDTGSSSHALTPPGPYTLGRGDDAGIKLDDSSVSRLHARLHLGAQVKLEDLGSANGTIVRGRRLEANETVELGAGDSVELGKTLCVLQPDELSDRARPWTLLSHARFVEVVNAARAPFAVLRLQVVGRPGLAQDVLSEALDAKDVVASFGPGMFEIFAPGRDVAAAKALGEKLSAKLVAAGARVRLGHAAAPIDGSTADELLVARARDPRPPRRPGSS